MHSKYINNLIEFYDDAEDFGVKDKANNKRIKNLIERSNELNEKIEELAFCIENIKAKKDLEHKAMLCQENVCYLMDEVRSIYDEIEVELPDENKPFPNYDDLLFLNND